jgi:hypothetical protein
MGMKKESNNNIKEEISEEDKWYMEWYMILKDTPFHGAPGG